MQSSKNFETSRFVVVPGRIDRWLNHPEQGTLNVSCTTKVANTDNPFEDWRYASIALRGAAGENLVVNSFLSQNPSTVDWSFYIDPAHTDFGKMGLAEVGKFGINNRIVIRVADSMTEDTETEPRSISIENSWELFYKCLVAGERVAVDLSLLRAEGTTNSHGLVASGPLSFFKIYAAIANYVEQGTLTSYLQVFSTINEVLRRGGVFKNGAITTTLDSTHPDALEYINLPLNEIPYLKKGLRVYPEILEDKALCDAVLKQVNGGSLWLEKDFGLHNGEQLYSNVCRGISLKDRSTCLIAQVNAGQIEHPEEWEQAWRDATRFVCSVFEVGAPQKAGIYRDPSTDRQVAVGVLGLANLLTYHEITYKEWTETFERFLDGNPRRDRRLVEEMIWYCASGVADAAMIARVHNMRAAFAIEPCASNFRRYKDLKGFTTCPNIDAPIIIPGSGKLRRNSEAVGSEEFDVGPVEAASQVGAELHYRHRVCWQRLFNSTGLAHGSSYELWSNWSIKEFKQWFYGPLPTTYYRRPISTTHLEKGRKILTAKQFQATCKPEDVYCEACGE